jgi:DNA-binding XRE family transcriptional regulator
MKRIVLQKARKRMGLTQAELAKKLGLKGIRTCYLWEAGRSNPSLPIAAKLSVMFNVSIEELFPDLFVE